MRNTIGIRRESIDATDRRAPLTPDQVGLLVDKFFLCVIVEPSSQRIFADEEYAAAGAKISGDLTSCNVVLGVREIPIQNIQPGQVYCFFSHMIKAQRYNMPMLRHIIESGSTLLDYELVTNESGRRLIFFGDFAGYAGMIDSMWALGKRLDWEGIPNPFSIVKRAREYADLEEAKAAVAGVGRQIQKEGLPAAITPFVCAFTGRGLVSKGAQKIFNLLPAVAVRPDDLESLNKPGAHSPKAVYRVEFRKPDLYAPLDPSAAFDLEDFNERPGRYRGRFSRYTEHLIMVVNGIRWSTRFPRLLTNEHMREVYARNPKPSLRVVGNITCDIEGSIEFTVRSTTLESPVFVYEPVTGDIINGYAGKGPVVLAVDRLPAEFPREASQSMGEMLIPFVRSLAAADFTQPLDALDLPTPFKKSVIAHQGQLTEHFRYLNEYLL